jgi:uncharacterized membrane protein
VKIPMTANHPSPEQHLLAQVDTCFQVFDKKRQKNKFLAFGLKISIAALGAATTVLLGISYSGKPDNLFKNIAIGLSALSAVIAAWDAFFNHRVLWLRYTVAANKMRALREEIRYQLSRDKGMKEEIADKFFAQYQTIIAEINNAWEDLRKTEPEKSDLPTAKNQPT